MTSGSKTWRDVKSIPECLEYIYGQNYQHDVTFTFERYPGEEVKAHKLILSMRSVVWAKQFYYCETPFTQKVIETGWTPNAFREFVNYFYRDTLDLTPDIVMECMHLARIYNIADIVSRCEELVNDCLSLSNVVRLYDQSRKFGLVRYESICLDFIAQHGDKILSSESVEFVALMRDSFLGIVLRDDLSCDEGAVFQAAMHWARCKCFQHQKKINIENMRAEMGGVLYAIRFPLMTLEAYNKTVAPVKLLTPEEQALIITHLTCRPLDPPPTAIGKFSAIRRPGTGNVNVNFPVAKATDICTPGSSDLVISAERDYVQLKSISGEQFPANEMTGIRLRVPGNDVTMNCPYVVCDNTIVFKPPVDLRCTVANTFTFEPLRDSKVINLRRRIRDCDIGVERIPYQAEFVQLHFNDAEDLTPEIDVVGE